MPKKLIEPSIVTLNGHEIACDIENAELLWKKAAPVVVTGVCDTFVQRLQPNIKEWKVNLGYFKNTDSSGTSASGILTVLNGLFNSTASTGVTLVFRDTTGNRGPTNNEWSGLVGIDGDVAFHMGKVAEADRGTLPLIGMGNLTWFTCSS